MLSESQAEESIEYCEELNRLESLRKAIAERDENALFKINAKFQSIAEKNKGYLRQDLAGSDLRE